LSLIWNESIEKDTDIRKPRLTEEKIISVLAEQERGMGTAEVCCKHGRRLRWREYLGKEAVRRCNARQCGLEISSGKELTVPEANHAARGGNA
jgi:hypothetical protein